MDYCCSKILKFDIVILGRNKYTSLCYRDGKKPLLPSMKESYWKKKIEIETE